MLVLAMAFSHLAHPHTERGWGEGEREEREIINARYKPKDHTKIKDIYLENWIYKVNNQEGGRASNWPGKG